jgi:hypothetical protein
MRGFDMKGKEKEMEFLKSMMGGDFPELQEWFLKTYSEDEEFKKAVDRLHFNLLSLQRPDFFETKIN